MWIWNDYLLPYLVLDLDKYRTIPIHIQYLQGSYGSVDLGAIMALIILSIIPVIYILSDMSEAYYKRCGCRSSKRLNDI